MVKQLPGRTSIGGGWGGVGCMAELLTCPYPLKVQACHHKTKDRLSGLGYRGRDEGTGNPCMDIPCISGRGDNSGV